jgi:hypothetical protein
MEVFMPASNKKELPVFITRSKAVEILGGIYARGTLANLDCKGLGPSEKIKVGGKIAYPRDSFVSWVKERTGHDIN